MENKIYLNQSILALCLFAFQYFHDGSDTLLDKLTLVARTRSSLSTRCHCNQSSRSWRINYQVVFNLVNVIVSDDSDVVGSKVGIATLCQDQISGVNVESLGQDTEVEDQVLKTGNAIGDVK